MNTAYRVWDGEQMYYWNDEGMSLTIKNNGDWTLKRLYTDVLVPVVDSTNRNAALMWGTGLKDKNGRVVYKGDNFTAKHKSGKVYRGQVKHDLSFVFDIENFEELFINGVGEHKRNRKFDIHSFIQWFNETEIVGDVFQNPELSEGME